MRKQRRNFSGTEKMAILREHLIEKGPISEVCDKHGLQPTVFYQWQKRLFEDGAVVFDQMRRKSPRQQTAEARLNGATAAGDSDDDDTPGDFDR
ncbi:MAG: transposase [Phycisphaerae bacterium]